MSIEEISDRLEIQDLMVRYSYAIDSRDWDALDDVFTPDAHIDYSVFGGSVGNLAETKAFLADAMPMFTTLQHMVSGTTLAFHGDADCTRLRRRQDPVPQPDDHGRRREARPHGVRALVRRQARAHRRRLAHQGAGRGERLHAIFPGK